MAQAIRIKTISPIMHIKSLATKEEYRELLFSENSEGLRPFELSSHLGTYTLFQLLFESNELYVSKVRESSFFSVLYFDITDYILGPRMQKSPPYTMILLDKTKTKHKSLHGVLLNDPMKSWFAAINYSNRPYHCLYFLKDHLHSKFRIIFPFRKESTPNF